MNTLFSIFNIIDIVLFIWLTIMVLYLFVFAIYSCRKSRIPSYIPSCIKNNFLVLFPAYKEDNVIVDSVKFFINNVNYPKDKYEILVIADHLKEETLNKLNDLKINIQIPYFKESTKAKALSFAIEQVLKNKLDTKYYDYVLIMDADNLASETLLDDMNNAFISGNLTAVQAHRTAKNRETATAVLDAANEEINNSIFRLGHVTLGFSSALIGSGMAFTFNWFKENVNKAITAGEDKEYEKLLLKQGIYIGYLPDSYVYDQKISTHKGFYSQRRRWLAAQFQLAKSSIKEIPQNITVGNFDYADKLYQWIMLPRTILMFLIFCMIVITTSINIWWSIKWWLLILILLFAFAFALPDNMLDKKLKRAVKALPFLTLLMIINMLRVKGAGKKFIHTQH